MNKRNINERQENRIRNKQKQYLSADNTLPTIDGLVITRFGKDALVETNEGKLVHCSIRPTLNMIVTGDKVVWQKEGEQGVIISHYPRISTLARVDKNGNVKPIAANLTQIIIVIACKPHISWQLLDSYLVLAEHLNLPAVILLNKTDLPSLSLQDSLKEIYTPLGYNIIFLNHNDPKGYKNLEKILQNETSIFVGQSGVGKSTLISKLIPEEVFISTSPLSIHSELGQHTTSSARLFHLSNGGNLIDSPGVREFKLSNLSLSDIANSYREFTPFLSKCKYRNCSHYKTQSCAIIDAVHNGLIKHIRYENYVKLAGY